MIDIKIYGKKEQLENPDFLSNVIFPQQTHGDNIIEIITGRENLENCDGIYSSRKNKFKLGIKTADCSAVVFYDEKKYGIIHAGWRGLVNGIVEKMMSKFDNPKIFVSPFLKRFEIQKDFCYDAIFDKFGGRFFEEENGKIMFNFEKSLKSILGGNFIFDLRNTLEDNNFYSYRRNKTQKRNWTIVENLKN